jgi:thiol-disulfide isomerase/thioredoxin
MARPIDQDRRRFLGAAALGLAALDFGWLSNHGKGAARMTSETRQPMRSAQGELASLARATAWLNTEPLTAEGLGGHVVVISFWTYTCINWLRTLPYVRAWAERYQANGLVMIGVHSPEFGFEHDLDNVRRAVQELRVGYPVAVDSDMAIWRAFDNNYWPALYFIDAQGRLRGHAYGEGDYETSERTIQGLLAETGVKGVGDDLVSVEGRGAEAAADWAHLKSGENYLGYQRTEHFSSPGGAVAERAHDYAVPPKLQLNQWALAGSWTMGRQALSLRQPNGRIVYRFHGRDLHLVMGPAERGRTIRFQVRLDGAPPGSAHGGDVDEQGAGVVDAQRMYQLIRQPGPIADRQFEIEFLDPGTEAFAFTFG